MNNYAKKFCKKIKKIFKKGLTNQFRCAIIVSRGEGNSPNKEKRIKKNEKNLDNRNGNQLGVYPLGRN